MQETHHKNYRKRTTNNTAKNGRSHHKPAATSIAQMLWLLLTSSLFEMTLALNLRVHPSGKQGSWCDMTTCIGNCCRDLYQYVSEFPIDKSVDEGLKRTSSQEKIEEGEGVPLLVPVLPPPGLQYDSQDDFVEDGNNDDIGLPLTKFDRSDSETSQQLRDDLETPPSPVVGGATTPGLSGDDEWEVVREGTPRKRF